MHQKYVMTSNCNIYSYIYKNCLQIKKKCNERQNILEKDAFAGCS